MSLLPGIGGAVGKHDTAIALHVPDAGEVVGHPGAVLERLELMQPLPGDYKASVDILHCLVKQERESNLQISAISVSFVAPQLGVNTLPGQSRAPPRLLDETATS